MKTLNNFFAKSASVKNIDDFSHFSLNYTQMNTIKGGTQPIQTEPGTPPPPPGSNNI